MGDFFGLTHHSLMFEARWKIFVPAERDFPMTVRLRAAMLPRPSPRGKVTTS
jgi:hypothetical protein